MPTYKKYLRDYQQKVLEETLDAYAQGYRALYNAGGVGTGKTCTSIFTLNELNKSREAKHNILCITNGSTRTNWGREILNLSSHPSSLEIYSSKDAEKLNDSHSWVVVSYKLILKPKVLKKILDWNFNFLICDEAQAIKNYKAKCTKVCYALGAISEFMLCLSGTPIKGSLEDMFPFLHFAKPNEVPNYYQYLETFCKKEETSYGSGTKYYDGKNIPKFRELLKPLFHRVKSEDVIEELPALTIDKIFIKGNQKELRAINEERDTVEFRTYINSIGEKETKVIPKNLHKFRRASYLIKHKDCKEFIENLLEQDIPVIAGFYYGETLDFVMEEFKKWGPRCIRGSTPSKKRQEYVDEFNRGEKLLLVGQIKSIGVGLNIQETCSTVVICETSYEPDDLYQIFGRIHRIGQTRPCFAYVMTLKDSIDEDLIEVILRKSRLIDRAIENHE